LQRIVADTQAERARGLRIPDDRNMLPEEVEYERARRRRVAVLNAEVIEEKAMEIIASGKESVVDRNGNEVRIDLTPLGLAQVATAIKSSNDMAAAALGIPSKVGQSHSTSERTVVNEVRVNAPERVHTAMPELEPPELEPLDGEVVSGDG